MAGTVKSKFLKLLFIYGYLYSFLVLAAWWLNYFDVIDFAIPALALWFVIATVIYQSALFKLTAHKFGGRMAYVISLGLLGTMMIVVTITTGGYSSLNNVPFIFLIFLSAMLGPTPPLTFVWIYVMGYILALSGAIPLLGSTTVGAFVTMAYTLAAICGWIVFRRLYVHHDPMVDDLQRALTAEQLQSAAVLASMNDGVSIINRDGITRHANQRFLDIMAMRPEDVMGKHYSEVVSKNVRITHSSSKTPRIGYNIANVFRTGKPVEIDVETIEYLDGRPSIDLSISLTPLKNDEGEVSAVMIVGHDISTLMKLQRLKDEFISNASHELRTPLTVISGYTDLLLNPSLGKLGDKQRHYVERTRETAQLLTKLVNDILDIGELDTGKRANKPETIHLKSFLESFVEDKKAHFAEKHIGLHLDAVPIHTYADPDRLRQVLDCLLSNAYKFTPENGKVTIKTKVDVTGMATISVIDTGPGVADDKQAAIFDTFTKLDSTGAEAGTGLGLAIARKIVSDWGGKIEVKNEPEGGAHFSFTIPDNSDSLFRADNDMNKTQET